MTSPTVHALFLCGRLGKMPDSFMAYRMRLWTGFRPSRTSGRARAVMTDMEYSMNDWRISWPNSEICRVPPCSSVSPVSTPRPPSPNSSSSSPSSSSSSASSPSASGS